MFFKDVEADTKGISLSRFKLSKRKYVRMEINDQCWPDGERPSSRSKVFPASTNNKKQTNKQKPWLTIQITIVHSRQT